MHYEKCNAVTHFWLYRDALLQQAQSNIPELYNKSTIFQSTSVVSFEIVYHNILTHLSYYLFSRSFQPHLFLRRKAFIFGSSLDTCTQFGVGLQQPVIVHEPRARDAIPTFLKHFVLSASTISTL